MIQIRPYQAQDQEPLVALWALCGLTRPWNDPRKDIARKQKEQSELFLVALKEDALIGSVMGGYDGHRGWVNYLAVAPSERRCGLGRQLMQAVEEALLERGCPKLNLQIRSENTEVLAFYQSLGYAEDPVISLGKRLIPDH